MSGRAAAKKKYVNSVKHAVRTRKYPKGVSRYLGQPVGNPAPVRNYQDEMKNPEQKAILWDKNYVNAYTGGAKAKLKAAREKKNSTGRRIGKRHDRGLKIKALMKKHNISMIEASQMLAGKKPKTSRKPTRKPAKSTKSTKPKTYTAAQRRAGFGGKAAKKSQLKKNAAKKAPAKKNTPRKNAPKKLSDYNKHVQRVLKGGGTMADAAATWRPMYGKKEAIESGGRSLSRYGGRRRRR